MFRFGVGALGHCVSWAHVAAAQSRVALRAHTCKRSSATQPLPQAQQCCAVKVAFVVGCADHSCDAPAHAMRRSRVAVLLLLFCALAAAVDGRKTRHVRRIALVLATRCQLLRIYARAAQPAAARAAARLARAQPRRRQLS
jgi:hypothetical protein